MRLFGRSSAARSGGEFTMTAMGHYHIVKEKEQARKEEEKGRYMTRCDVIETSQDFFFVDNSSSSCNRYNEEAGPIILMVHKSGARYDVGYQQDELNTHQQDQAK